MLRAIRLRSIAGDQRGTSLVEFGFLAPVLAVLVMGIIDLSKALSDRFTLQQAVNRGLELVQARPVAADDSGDVDYDFVETEAETAAGTGAQAAVTQWNECNGVEMTEICDSGEDSARYLRVRVTKNFQGQFFLGTTPMSASGTLRIQ